jgi:hypothetical protein
MVAYGINNKHASNWSQAVWNVSQKVMLRKLCMPVLQAFDIHQTMEVRTTVHVTNTTLPSYLEECELHSLVNKRFMDPLK